MVKTSRERFDSAGQIKQISRRFGYSTIRTIQTTSHDEIAFTGHRSASVSVLHGLNGLTDWPSDQLSVEGRIAILGADPKTRRHVLGKPGRYEMVHSGNSFAECERASVAVSSALALPAILGVVGLALEFGDALVTRAETQLVADLAVHAAILAYRESGDTQAMTLAARNVAQLNGIAPDETFVVLDSDNSSGPVARVRITTPRPLVLSRVFAASNSLDVTVRSAATLDHGQAACVQALDANGAGISLSGGTSITTAGCAVSSNASVTATGGSRIETETLSYDSSTAPVFSGGASISAPDGSAARIVRSSAPDPLAGNAAISLAEGRLTTVAAMQAPTMPSVTTGPNIDFGWNIQATQQQATAVGCAANLAGSTWNFTCPSGATITLGNLTIGGGLNLDFALGGTADTTYIFSGFISNTGTSMRFGPANYDIAGGIFTSGGTTTRFGAGTLRIGRASTACGGSARYSICNTSSMIFDGPLQVELEGGISNSGGASISLGTGQANSFRIGPASNGDALTLGGGSNTLFGDATGAGGRFEVVGNTRTGGNSCLVIGAAAHHDFAGHLNLEGGVIFGSGLYTIDGYLHLGASGGGSSWCQGESISMRALGVTFVLSGSGVQLSNQNCRGRAAFCAGSGYNSMQIIPPSSGSFANLAVLGPLSPSVTVGAAFEGGAHGSQISGTFYFPHGPISLSGGASASGSSVGCLQIIGASVALSGGTSIASECVMGDTLGTARVRMIE